MSELKVFAKWDTSGVEFRDRGMARYINVDAVRAPSGSAPSNERFRDEVPVVERFVNKLMRGGRNTGKKAKMFRAVEDAFDRIAESTGENPVQVFVQAVENSGPREETVRLKYGGIAVQKPVDASPQRRVNTALKHLAEAVYSRSHKSGEGVSEAMADEVARASDYDMESYAVKKKEETERVASAAR
ncbi:MAG: 30S ribosomal protein S7 [Methanonatronarchaeales archaeon]|nr:30S ribosomal protein S7 [Methanonatronarchaeales archaeon]